METTIQEAIQQLKPAAIRPITDQETSDLERDFQTVVSAISKIAPWFDVDKDNERAIWLLTAYFTGNQIFESEGFSLDKGIYLKGPVGTGKTTLMEVFRELTLKGKRKRVFQIISTRDLSKLFANQGFKALEIFGKSSFRKKSTGYGESILYDQPINRCFDDFGLEDNAAKFYGQSANVMAEIILDRYEMYRQHHMVTHVTTNLGSGDDVERIYGDRVRSRMREMFNDIELTGNDRRR
jgi:predicted ATPase